MKFYKENGCGVLLCCGLNCGDLLDIKIGKTSRQRERDRETTHNNTFKLVRIYGCFCVFVGLGLGNEAKRGWGGSVNTVNSE